MSDPLLYEVKENVAYLIINREDRGNSITQEMLGLFHNYLDLAQSDNEVRAACITSTGDHIFCSGADLGFTLTEEPNKRLDGPRRYAELLKKMTEYEKPIVAKVNGPCLAGGLGIMLSCDIVISREDAYFCTPEVNVGIFPMMVGALLLKHVGLKRTMDMVLTARKVSALEAETWGLITRAVPFERLNKEVDQILQGLIQKSPIGIKIGKKAFRDTWDLSFDKAVEHLCKALGEIISTEDAVEGMKAFLEKRKPDFKGR